MGVAGLLVGLEGFGCRDCSHEMLLVFVDSVCGGITNSLPNPNPRPDPINPKPRPMPHSLKRTRKQTTTLKRNLHSVMRGEPCHRCMCKYTHELIFIRLSTRQNYLYFPAPKSILEGTPWRSTPQCAWSSRWGLRKGHMCLSMVPRFPRYPRYRPIYPYRHDFGVKS